MATGNPPRKRVLQVMVVPLGPTCKTLLWDLQRNLKFRVGWSLSGSGALFCLQELSRQCIGGNNEPLTPSNVWNNDDRSWSSPSDGDVSHKASLFADERRSDLIKGERSRSTGKTHNALPF